MDKFNFYNFLEENGYQKETIQGSKRNNFLHKLPEGTYREYLELSDGTQKQTITGASLRAGLVFKQIPQLEKK